jgi:ABC-2 type transport system permease protein
LGKLAKYLKLYILIIYLNLKARSRYVVNFALAFVQSFLSAGTSIAIVWIMLERFKDINGWSMYEIGFMFALGKIAFALNMTFFQQVWAMDLLINMGEIDKVLIRPKSSLFLFVCQRFDVMWLGDLLAGFIVLFYTGAKAYITWNAANISFAAILLVCSTLIFASLMFLAGTTAFWFFKSRSLREFVLSLFMLFYPYPVPIYGKGIQYVLTFFIPLAFIYYYPSLYIFNKSDNLFPRWIAFCTPLAALVLACVCILTWNAGLRAYKSSGT